jgi:hypothetical protein
MGGLMAPRFFLTCPEKELPIMLYPPPLMKRDDRLYRLVGFITRRSRIFIRWNLMDLADG